MVFNKSFHKNQKSNNQSPSIPIDRNQLNQTVQMNSTNYPQLISPAAGLNEKELSTSLGFLSIKAPKKKLNLKKVTINDLKEKRKRLENYFTSIDLENWSERNFVYPNTKSENWHDDLHYIVLKQQQKSNFLHQLWLILMLILLCIMLISIAGLIYSKNGIHHHKDADQTNSFEFIQKFIDDFNTTDSPHKQEPDSSNRYHLFGGRQYDESFENWLKRKAKYWSTFLGGRSNGLSLNLTKKSIPDNELRSIDHNNLNQVDYELIADESSIFEKIEDEVKDRFSDFKKKINLKSLVKKVDDMF